MPGKSWPDTRRQPGCGSPDTNKRDGQGSVNSLQTTYLIKLVLHACVSPPYRSAAEEQIHDLQGIIDETFKQFALDDSEDDYCEDDLGSMNNSDTGSLLTGQKQTLLDSPERFGSPELLTDDQRMRCCVLPSIESEI